MTFENLKGFGNFEIFKSYIQIRFLNIIHFMIRLQKFFLLVSLAVLSMPADPRKIRIRDCSPSTGFLIHMNFKVNILPKSNGSMAEIPI